MTREKKVFEGKKLIPFVDEEDESSSLKRKALFSFMRPINKSLALARENRYFGTPFPDHLRSLLY